MSRNVRLPILTRGKKRRVLELIFRRKHGRECGPASGAGACCQPLNNIEGPIFGRDMHRGGTFVVGVRHYLDPEIRARFRHLLQGCYVVLLARCPQHLPHGLVVAERHCTVSLCRHLCRSIRQAFGSLFCGATFCRFRVRLLWRGRGLRIVVGRVSRLCLLAAAVALALLSSRSRSRSRSCFVAITDIGKQLLHLGRARSGSRLVLCALVFLH
mmetsp:Transcript_29372/g.68197  ORF Transcript_29372/g.68197 Transcript_29372/m.68197 type:complete len:213 (+) Transcript_29372:506-1144(+)